MSFWSRHHFLLLPLFLGNLAYGQRLYIPIRGVNSHLANGPELDAVTQMHLNWVRLDFNWATIQPTQSGPFDWNGSDRAVEAATSRGIHVLANLNQTPAWACRAGDSGTACVPRSSTEWQTFVHAVADRYRGAVNAYGLWNEPDEDFAWHGTATEYATIILAPGAQTIRATDSVAIITAPDLSGSFGAPISAREMFDAMTAVNASALIDVVSLHAYEENALPGPNGILSKVFDYLVWDVDWNGDLTNKPIWITEFGFTQGGDDPPSGGNAIEAVFELFGPRERVGGLFDFMLQDDGPHLQGLLKASGEWKPGAYYLQSHLPYDDWVPDPPLLKEHFDYPWSVLLHRWTVPTGTALLRDGGITSTTQGFAAKITTLPQADFSIEATVHITDTLGQPTNWLGLLGRTSSLTGTYTQGGYLGLLRANGQAVLWSAAGLSLSTMTTANPTAEYVRLRLTCTGSRISLAINGVELLVANDTTYTSGYAGIQHWAIGSSDNVLLRSPSSQEPRPEPLSYNTITPCRLIDTRDASGGNASISSGLPVRHFVAWGRCGIPTRAIALVGNATATNETAGGSFRVFPAGYAVPASSVVSFAANTTRACIANVYVNAPNSAPGAFDVYLDAPPGNSAHFIFDVTGFFAPAVAP